MNINKDKQAWVIGLCIACPHGQELDECPVRHIRPKTVKERVEAVIDMAEELVESHLGYHAKCSATRAFELSPRSSFSWV